MTWYTDARSLDAAVREAVDSVRILDIHTHLYPASFGSLLLWGIDELLTYHYLIAEVMRVAPETLSYEDFYRLSKSAQADMIWDALFVKRSPLSEACRGIVTTIAKLGIDPNEKDLNTIRKGFASVSTTEQIDRVFELAGVDSVIMTNNPFDAEELPAWEAGGIADGRFKAALRIDDILLNLPAHAGELRQRGYHVNGDLSENSTDELRRFLTDWFDRIDPWYVAASVSPEFDYPGDERTRCLLDDAILPAARDKGLPFALMAGVKRAVNPRLGLAGDGVGTCDPGFVERLCAANPDNKFLLTMLPRENQHALVVIARKFRNLHVFGCWWFVNNPSIIREMTAQRLEMLGLSFTPQHSDARVLDQLIYKWTHSRRVIGEVLAEHYHNLHLAGYEPTADEISHAVSDLFGGAFRAFVGR